MVALDNIWRKQRKSLEHWVTNWVLLIVSTVWAKSNAGWVIMMDADLLFEKRSKFLSRLEYITGQTYAHGTLEILAWTQLTTRVNEIPHLHHPAKYRISLYVLASLLVLIVHENHYLL